MTVDPIQVRQFIRFATLRTGNAIFDDDLTQEACMRALDAFRRTRDVAHPRAFLMKIVCDTVRDHWRRRRPADRIDSVDERFLCFTPDLDTVIDRDRQSDLLRA